MVLLKCRLCKPIASVLILYYTLFFTAIVPVAATQVSGAEQKIGLVYSISWGNLRLAEATSQLLLADNKALITGTISGDGVVAMFAGFESASTAEIERKNEQWVPVFLSLSRVTKSKKVSSSVHWSPSGIILSDVQEPPLNLSDVHPITDVMKQDVIDPYSAMMRQIDEILVTGRCGGSYSVYDGLRRFDLEFDSMGPAKLKADRLTAFSGDVLLCSVVTMPHGGHRVASDWHKKSINDLRLLVYFGRFAENLILPVRIEINASLGTGIVRLDMDRSVIP